MEQLMAYINSTLPKRLQEVLDYQPSKYQHAVNAREPRVLYPIATSQTAAQGVSVGIHTEETSQEARDW